MEELINRLIDQFHLDVNQEAKARKILANIANGTGTYGDAGDLAYIVGKKLSGVLSKGITEDVISGLNISLEEAETVLKPLLREGYAVVIDPTEAVQTTINQKAGLGLKAKRPAFNEDRAQRLCEKIASYDSLEDSKWLLDSPIVNFVQAVVDESVRINSEFQFNAGLNPKIVRKPSSGACDWCLALAGSYEYPGVPSDVFKRHEDCNCTVEYNPGGKKVQDVWSKKWKEKQETEKKERIDNLT